MIVLNRYHNAYLLLLSYFWFTLARWLPVSTGLPVFGSNRVHGIGLGKQYNIIIISFNIWINSKMYCCIISMESNIVYLLSTSLLSSIPKWIFLWIFIYWKSRVPTQVFTSFFSSYQVPILVITIKSWIVLIIVIWFHSLLVIWDW